MSGAILLLLPFRHVAKAQIYKPNGNRE